ncbi:MAG: DUF6064 family protein [Pseudomonadota bacterium]
MSEWWRYDVADFLLFAPQTYWRLFALQNAAYWPLQIAASVGVTALLVLALARWRWTGALGGLLLSAATLFVALTFLRDRYEPINWAIGGALPLFYLQAALVAVLGPRLSFVGGSGWGGIALLCLSLAYPLLAPLDGRPLNEAEVVGLAPDPTAVAILGFAGLARCGWAVLTLVILPLLWLLVSAATLFTMGAATAFVPVGAVVVAIASLLYMCRRRRRAANRPQ